MQCDQGIYSDSVASSGPASLVYICRYLSDAVDQFLLTVCSLSHFSFLIKDLPYSEIAVHLLYCHM